MRGYLEPGERVCLEARPHGVALVRELVPACVLAVGGGALVMGGTRTGWGVAAVGAVALALAALLALVAVWRWDRTQVVLTTEKLLVVYGVARRRAAAVRLARVGAVEVEQSLLGRLLGYATVVAGDLEVPYVPRARELYRLLG